MFGLLPRGTAYFLILLLALYAGAQYVPIYYGAMQFHDAIRQEVKFAGTSRRSVRSVREEIMRLADRYTAPVLEEDVEVTVEVTRDGPIFVVDVYYEVPVDMRIYQHAVEFDWRLSGETFAE